LGVHPNVVAVQNFVKLKLDIWCDQRHGASTRVNLVDEIELLLNVVFFSLELCLDSLLVDVVAVLHGEPLETRHEFVHHFAHFVAVGHTPGVDFDIVLP
jgi:hypothetical protein